MYVLRIRSSLISKLKTPILDRCFKIKIAIIDLRETDMNVNRNQLYLLFSKMKQSNIMFYVGLLNYVEKN